MQTNLTDFTTKLAKNPPKSKKELFRVKRVWAKFSKAELPKNSQILKTYRQLVKKGRIKINSPLEKILKLKKVRSQSGIIPVAVLTKPYPCPGKCIYCPTQKGVPKSYLADEPAVLRAQMFDFDPYLQTKKRIEQLAQTGHATDKVELIVIGGTFSSLPKKYQEWFIKRCFDAANKELSKNTSEALEFTPWRWNKKNLTQAQKLNEKAKSRIIGLTLETRPDFINKKEIKWFRKLGCTRVEIGVQSLDDKILKKVKRGHTVKQTIKATKLLKNAGFKICYHMMPNLPGSTPKKDLEQFKKLFTDKNFKPDMLKIYPTMIIPSSELYQWYKKGKFKPYSDKQLIDLLIKIKQVIPLWVRINRLVRDIPAGNIAAGSKLSNMRQILHQKMSSRGRSAYDRKCSCIRCREIKYRKLRTENLELRIYKYKANKGEEYFLQFVDKKRKSNFPLLQRRIKGDFSEKLYALLRLRIPSKSSSGKHFIKELKNAAIIRELHVFGEAVKIGKHKKSASQHKGLGEKLLKKAEKIAKKKGIKKLAIIAGIGAREYYRKLGYKLEETYMIKYL